MGDGREGRTFGVGEEKMVPRCSLQMGSEMRSYTPSREVVNTGSLKYTVKI